MGAIDNLVDRSLKIEQAKIDEFNRACNEFIKHYLDMHLCQRNPSQRIDTLGDRIKDTTYTGYGLSPSELEIFKFVRAYMKYNNNPVDLGVSK